MESDAGDFFWPSRGADNETASTRAKGSTLRLLVTKTPFTLWLVCEPALPEKSVWASSLCNLCVLCVSVVKELLAKTTTETQRTLRLHREVRSIREFSGTAKSQAEVGLSVVICGHASHSSLESRRAGGVDAGRSSSAHTQTERSARPDQSGGHQLHRRLFS